MIYYKAMMWDHEYFAHTLYIKTTHRTNDIIRALDMDNKQATCFIGLKPVSKLEYLKNKFFNRYCHKTTIDNWDTVNTGWTIF